MPFWTFQIDSPLPGTAVEDRIRQLLRTKRKQTFLDSLVGAFEPPQDEPPFDGSVTGRTFRLVRVIGYRNSFVPVIRGRISDSPHGGTTVRVRMTLHLVTALFMAAWLGFVGAGVAWSSLGDLDNIDPHTSLLLGMMLFGVLLPVVGFYPEVRKAERLLRTALAQNPRQLTTT